jgi:hypothetical protein
MNIPNIIYLGSKLLIDILKDLLEGRPDRTQEKLDAYADYQSLKEQEIEDAERRSSYDCPRRLW